jgi:ATP-dependent exoDNAse (exonuclease V) beta subunit
MRKEIKKKYHPTLVWTEIRSFIKGSAEALNTDQGFLSMDEYQELGRKRAPNFEGNRSAIYGLFEFYQRFLSSKEMFDEADVVFQLNKRLTNYNCNPPWSIHSVYVDETQDFTQAELSLLVRCCRDRNRMFFTGDTAQSIMRGIAFRFEDITTLFHALKSFDKTINIPKGLSQLTHNYRSHAGILRLASSVVKLLYHLFPRSLDKLEDDSALFEGPKPVLLESCSKSDLAMILRGNKRETSRIEFGAHQAVLVVSEEARDNMPEELKHGLVLTIYEAKGLEFDDVLIYNFFTDSQVSTYVIMFGCVLKGLNYSA